MPLTDVAVRGAKPATKDRKIADEKGLYLLITPTGSKLWRYKYRFNGREKKLALGAYPEVQLKAARAAREAARAQLDRGADPAAERRAARVAALVGAANTFEAVAEEYVAKVVQEGRADITIAKARWLLEQLRPALGRRPIADIKPFDLLTVLQKVEKAGKRETARRLRSFASRVFRYAIATARAEIDPAQPLLGALVAPVVRHHAAVTDPIALGTLLRAIEGYTGRPSTIAALRLSPHLFQRPGEIRQMEWAELDLANAVWRIPAARMKKRQPHDVPLSKQAIAILEQLHELTGKGRYVFSSFAPSCPMSENTINQALRRLGYGKDVMTAHGFRSTASSLLNESGKFSPDAIERALSHAETNRVRAAYHRSEYWEERVRMAQWWSDHLDTLKSGAQVIPLRGVNPCR